MSGSDLVIFDFYDLAAFYEAEFVFLFGLA